MAIPLRLGVICFWLAAAIACWNVSSAAGAFPGNNGKIAFARDGQIFVMNANGSGQDDLTSNPSTDFSADWSADGAKIAFASGRDGNFEIYTMNANGSAQTRRTTSAAADNHPGWSPNGQKIAFESNRNGPYEIFTMNANGTAQTRLSLGNNPAWSPDGQRIAFESSRPPHGGNFEIYVMNANGSGQTRLTNDEQIDMEPTWSPDGQKIAFSSTRDGNHEIYVMNANGSAETRLTNNAATDTDPDWSPDGRKIAFARAPAGPNEIFVMNANGTGPTNLTNNAAQDLAPSWQSIPASCPDVQVGFATAQGCFTETAPGSGIFETDRKAWVGGFEIRPRPGGKLILDTGTPAVSESGAGVNVIFAGFVVPLPVSTLPVGVPDGSVDVNQPGSAEKAILDLPVKGQAKVQWAQGGTEASFEAEIELEKLAAPIGALVTTSSLTGIGQTGGKLKAKLVNGRGFVLDAAEVAIQEINVIPSSLRVPRTLSLRNLLLRFELRNAKPFWTGQAGIRLPLTRGALDVTGKVFVFDGFPAGGGLAIDGLNRPLGGTPIFLQSVAGDLLFAPTFGFDLTVGGSLGPRVNGRQLLTLTGTMQAGETARADCAAGDDPSKLIFTSKLTPLEPLAAVGLAEAEMSGRSCIYTGTDPAMELTAAVKVAFLGEAMAYEASQTGFVSTRGANLEGAATLKLPALPDLQGQAIISTKGTAACTNLTFFQGGFGHRWGASTPPSAFSGCDLGPFRVTATNAGRGARRAAIGSVDVPAGLPHAGFAATGTSGPPRVSITGPGGFSASSPSDGSALQSHDAVIVPVDHENTTYVFVRKPKAGAWRLGAADQANPLTRVRFAAGLPDPKVKGRVSEGAKKYRLSYTLRKIPGQKVTLYERGEGITRSLGKVREGRGSISFKPTIAANRKRTIEAEVIQDGLPRELVTVASFKAPKQPKLAQPKLTAKRKKSSLTLRWPRVRGAAEYVAEVDAGPETLYRVVTEKRRLRFAGTPKKGKLELTVQALSEVRPPGPVARLTVKKPKRR